MQEHESQLNEALQIENADVTEETVTTVETDVIAENAEAPVAKPKKSRKRKTEEAKDVLETTTPHEEEDVVSILDQTAPAEHTASQEQEGAEASFAKLLTNESKKPSRRGVRANSVLTLESGGMVETEQNLADIAWHTIHNAYRTRRMMSGTFSGIEVMEDGKSIGVVEFSGYRVLIPLKEMTLGVPEVSQKEYRSMIQQYLKRFSNMLGAEIDFVIKGIDSATRSVVASRKDALLKKRQTFYMEPDASGEVLVRTGRTVQARIIGVHEKVLRVEIFGVETTIFARDLSWEWIGDVADHYAVGDTVLVRITEVQCEDVENITVKAEVKSLHDPTKDKLKLCRLQSKYAGKVIDVRKGIVFIRLANGVNAIAHSCYDRRMPGKKDDVSFVVTRIDEERGVAVGLISRIIKQNI